MAREFGEDFFRPIDSFNGVPYEGAPRTSTPMMNTPGSRGVVRVVDVAPDEKDTPGRVQNMFQQSLGGSRVDGCDTKDCPTIAY
jgi:hypothetical protein